MPRILVIDDEPNIRSILSALLEELGYDVEIAKNGEKGVKLFDEMSDFDLVITDIRMPNMDGNEVVRYIRNSDKSGTPVIAITAFPEELLQEMFDASLSKPFKLEDFSYIVRSFVKTEI